MPCFFTKLKIFTSFIINQQNKNLHIILNKTQNFNLKFKPITNFKRKIDKKSLASTLAVCGLFSWDVYRINDDEVKSEINDILEVFKNANKANGNSSENACRINFEASRKFEDVEWTQIYDKPDLLIWRRKIGEDTTNGLDIFEHKVLGRCEDLTPLEYYNTQLDLEYRKEWDFLIKHLEMIKKDTMSKTELVRWISKFPYPLTDREYMFVRRCCIEPDEKLLIVLSRGLPELDDLPFDKKTVKVTQYKSNMIIIPFTDFDKPGIYYVIQYYDVNKAKIPKLAYKWMAKSGLPDYVGKLHKATVKMRNDNSVNSTKKIDNYELFYSNKKAIEIPERTNTSESESEINFYENSNENQLNKNKIIKIEEKTVNTTNANEEVINKEEILSTNHNVLVKILIEITKKWNQDYLNEHEPHPIFFNY